jgi:uncharacterized RDD family membrane protein YckC
MRQKQRDRSLGEGVYYAPDDYAGALRRLVIWLVDGSALVVGWIALVTVSVALTGDLAPVIFPAFALSAWIYLAVLKPSRFRTLGYWLTGSRIVNLQGERPSIFWMTLRMSIWFIIPGIWISDLLWCGIDEDRQSIRDRYFSTCLINNGARPAGTGEIHLAIYFAFGYTLMYPDLIRPNRSVVARQNPPHTDGPLVVASGVSETK